MKLIDKSTIVDEIEKKIEKYATINVGDCKELEIIYGAKCKALMEILSFIDTLEVKEVSLESEMQYHEDIKNAFKDGYELGLIHKKENKL